MQLARIKEFLDGHNIKYVNYLVISHRIPYTAQETAELTHIPGRELAKAVIVKIDGALAMAALPASSQLDLSLFRAAANADSAELALESEFTNRFPDCETGGMPLFGNLYGMSVFADESLSRSAEIAFKAGSHRKLVQLRWGDFEKLVNPNVAKFATLR